MENKKDNWPINVQTVRIFDVLLVGPFMIFVGTKKELDKTIRWALIGIGMATILYNGINYLNNKK